MIGKSKKTGINFVEIEIPSASALKSNFFRSYLYLCAAINCAEVPIDIERGNSGRR